jgi:hypothetical protein
MIESGLSPQKIAETLVQQAERVREGLPTEEEQREYFSDEIVIVSKIASAHTDDLLIMIVHMTIGITSACF